MAGAHEVGVSRAVLVVFVLFGRGRIHPVLVMFFERRLKFLVLAPFVNRRPAFPFGSGEGDVSLGAGHAGRRRQQPFEILPFAGWARRRVRPANERLEFVSTGAALVFI